MIAATKQTTLNDQFVPVSATQPENVGVKRTAAVDEAAAASEAERVEGAGARGAEGALSCEVRAAWTLTGTCQGVGDVDVQARPTPAVEARAADRLEVAATAKGAVPSEQELALQAQVAALQAQLAAAQAESKQHQEHAEAATREAEEAQRAAAAAEAARHQLMQGEGGVDQLKAELDELRRANTGSVIAAGASPARLRARCTGKGARLRTLPRLRRRTVCSLWQCPLARNSSSSWRPSVGRTKR